MIDNFWAVVPAGGAGTRLWPVSRATAPKFLRDLRGSGRTLIQETHDRLVPLAGERLVVVTGAAHAAAVAEQLPDVPADSIIAEPSARDSMAAIGLAAALLERRDPHAVMGSFAADHVITDPDGFGDAVRTAVAVAREDWLVTLGILGKLVEVKPHQKIPGDRANNSPLLRTLAVQRLRERCERRAVVTRAFVLREKPRHVGTDQALSRSRVAKHGHILWPNASRDNTHALRLVIVQRDCRRLF